MKVLFFKKKQKEMKVVLTLNEKGVEISLKMEEGKKGFLLSPPLNKSQIEEFYKVPGFLNYVAWEELYEQGLLEDNCLTFENYYQLLKVEEGKEVLEQLGLPIEEMNVRGELTLQSLPQDADLKLILYNHAGKVLDRIGKQTGGLFQMNDQLFLLPETIFTLKDAMIREYDNGYQKAGVCQKLAEDAGIELENFLQKESYHVVDQYDLDVKVHNPHHIELIPKGKNEHETEHLNQPSSVSSIKDGFRRERYVKSTAVLEDIRNILSTKHIKGEKVPAFLENPSSVLPEHDYMIDLEAFSERVLGLVPIERVRPYQDGGTGFQWFDDESGKGIGYDPEFLKDLMERFPNQQYVEHEGKWIYLDPTLRKKLLEIDDDEENKMKQHYALDIKDNEEELDYFIDSNIKTHFHSYPIPKMLKANLFPHQEEGFQWLCNLESKGIGGLLADDMGLGSAKRSTISVA